MAIISNRRSDSILATIGRGIYSIRWGMIPMYCFLWFAILAYNFQFFREGWTFFTSGDHTSEDWLLYLVNALDMTMIGNLVVMVTIGGYSTFVREFLPQELGRMPRWMLGLTTTGLKIKLGMSLVSLSSVQLLHTFIVLSDKPGTFNANIIITQCSIHVLFIISYIAFGVYERYLHHDVAAPTTIDNADTHSEQHNVVDLAAYDSHQAEHH